MPQKRATPESDEDAIVVNVKGSTPLTPTTNRTVKRNVPSPTSGSPSRPTESSLTTPRSDRSVSIPIRSPSGRTPTIVRQPFAVKSSARKIAASSRGKPEVSFSDISSSIPSSIPSSSHRVEENGKLVAVRDSDSDDSLGDLSTLFSKPSKRSEAVANARISRLDREEMERRTLLDQFTNGGSEAAIRRQRTRERELADLKAKERLKSIFDEERRERERDERIAEANAELEASNLEIDEVRQRERDKNMLAAILQGGDENIEDKSLGRLMEAVDRTELFTQDKAYSFFTRAGLRSSPKQKKHRNSFPMNAIPGSLWRADDTDACNRNFLSGFMTELAANDELGDAALRWTFEASLCELDEHLQTQYLHCVTSGSKTWTRANITPQEINDIFASLGADLEALQENAPIVSRVQRKQDLRHSESQPLLRTLRLMSAICQDLDFPTLSRLCSITIRLSLDRQVAHSLQASEAVEALLYKLINLPDVEFCNHVHERLRADLGRNLHEPALQAQFLDHLLPTTSATARLRKQLAVQFLLPLDKAEKFLARPSLRSLNRHISKSDHFRTRTVTSDNVRPEDYHTLTSLTTILDVLVADGYPPAATMTKAEQLEFDATVDSFADRIHSLFASIADTGASHMRRTEAKDALQALHHRLVYSVRTTPKPKRHVFDFQGNYVGSKKGTNFLRPVADVEQEERDRKFMEKFLKKKREKSMQEQSESMAEVMAQSSPAEFADAMEQQ